MGTGQLSPMVGIIVQPFFPVSTKFFLIIFDLFLSKYYSMCVHGMSLNWQIDLCVCYPSQSVDTMRWINYAKVLSVNKQLSTSYCEISWPSTLVNGSINRLQTHRVKSTPLTPTLFNKPAVLLLTNFQRLLCYLSPCLFASPLPLFVAP